ncbi:unnamed protein product [Lathyrus oleraceus]|uniref:uncharacterized protein LOC127124215 isoform X2 n=1 Tax=Pisum sativum TaxID=3888 RepID=UPI0021D21657|nr:uncharacterized protein LOC127124215 isoform X2 [Pisum sativum]
MGKDICHAGSNFRGGLQTLTSTVQRCTKVVPHRGVTLPGNRLFTQCLIKLLSASSLLSYPRRRKNRCYGENGNRSRREKENVEGGDGLLSWPAMNCCNLMKVLECSLWNCLLQLVVGAMRSFLLISPSVASGSMRRTKMVARPWQLPPLHP